MTEILLELERELCETCGGNGTVYSPAQQGLGNDGYVDVEDSRAENCKNCNGTGYVKKQ